MEVSLLGNTGIINAINKYGGDANINFRKDTSHKSDLKNKSERDHGAHLVISNLMST